MLKIKLPFLSKMKVNFEDSFEILSLINRGHGSVPIYWILNGTSTLKNHLPNHQEIYKINTHYDRKTIFNNSLTIEIICQEFSDAIFKNNKGNHCIIGGFSIGARFAYETAQQLKKHGMVIDLLILLDPVENKDDKVEFGDTCNKIKSLYYIYTKSLPPDKFRKENIYQFYKSLRRKHLLYKYEGKVLLMQKRINISFENRDWLKIANPTNLTFVTLDTDDHMDVVYNSDVQLQWINKIKEQIYS
jgi:hypothetical protein